MSLPDLRPQVEGGVPRPRHQTPPIASEAITWRSFKSGPFWQGIPAWRDVTEEEFLDALWQERHSVTSAQKLASVLADTVSAEFLRDVESGLARSPMSVRVSPYIISLIDWSRPYTDSLRRQFLPLRSQLEPAPPLATLDSGNELADSPTPGLTHRYFDRALFLVTD